MTKRTIAQLTAEDLYDYSTGSAEDSDTPHEASSDDTYDPMDVDEPWSSSTPDSYNSWLDLSPSHWEDQNGTLFDTVQTITNVADSLGVFQNAYDSFGGDFDVANSVIYNDMLNDEDLQKAYEVTAADAQKYHYCRWYHLLEDSPNTGVVQCGVCGRKFTAATMPLPPDF